jgi:hypothetical protein
LLRFALSKSFPDLKLEPLEPAEILGGIQAKAVWQSQYITAWEMMLASPLPAGKTALFRFSYTGGEKPGDVLYVSDQGAYASGSSAVWYPEIVLPVVNNPPVIGSIRYAVPTGYTLVASGEQTTTEEDRKEGYQRFELKSPGVFTFGMARYNVLRRNGAPSIVFYLLKPRSYESEYVDRVRRTIDILVEEFGPYPGDRWILVEAPGERRFGGGSGGLIFVSSVLLNEGWNTALFAHEISHAWFGGDFLANEGMANYAALRVIERLQGPAAAERFRRTGEPGYNENQSGLGFLRISAAGLEAPLSDTPSSSGAQQVAYGKGMLAFDMLAQTIGRASFHSFLKQYLAEERRRHFEGFSWPAYFERLGKYSHRDLGWFYRQWFGRMGAPRWILTWTQAKNQVTGIIKQQAPHYRLQLYLEIITERGTTIRKKLTANAEETFFTVPVSSPVSTINIDPHYYVLHSNDEYQRLSQLLIPYTRYTLSGYPSAVAELRSNLTKVTEPDLFGAAFLLHYSAAKILLKEKDWQAARLELESALECPSRRPETLPAVYMALADVAKELHDNELYRSSLRAAMTADSLAPVSSDLGHKARLRLEETDGANQEME